MSVSSTGSLPEALSRAVDGFRKRDAPYVLIGAWALAVWGRPRATLDVDFMVLVNEEELESLGSTLGQGGMKLDETWLKYNPLLRGLQLRLQFREVTIDLLRPRDVHDQHVFRRRQKKCLQGRYYWLIAPEDFILQKLKVGRPRDFEDALSVLERLGKTLDKQYLRRWAGRIGVSGELKYIFSL